MPRNFQQNFKKTPGRLFGLALITTYQKTLSHLIGKQCCFFPSCSEYAYEAIARHGLWHGSILTLFRLLRCHPFYQCGIDKVPLVLPKQLKWYKICCYYAISYRNYKKSLLFNNKNN